MVGLEETRQPFDRLRSNENTEDEIPNYKYKV